MKKITTVIALLITLSSVTELQAQTDRVGVEAHSQFPADDIYENGTAGGARSQRLTLSDVSIKAVRSFKNYFNDSESPAWYPLNGKYLAKFDHGNRRTSALFAKDGTLLYSASYGSEKDLPEGVKNLVRTAYEDHKIGVVTEVHAMQQHAWIINLESYGRVMVVRYMDGQLDELKSYLKK